jgi:mono/diheme cytochrome c family protein
MDNKKIEAELDFKELIKSPTRLFGLIYPYFLILFLIVGIYFVKHLEYLTFNQVPPILTDSLYSQELPDVEVKKGGVKAAVDLAVITNASSDIINKGKELFVKNCSSCHGNEGKGDGPAAVALNPPPRNFHKLEGWTNGTKFSDIYKSVQVGVPGTGMSPYDFIPVGDRIAIIQYIRSLAKYPAVTKNEVAQLDKKYNLSKGEYTPSNITLEMATNKILEEKKISKDIIDGVLDKLNKCKDKETLSLLNNYVSDKAKVVTIFSRDFSNNKDVSKFINRVITSPTESGFKTSVTSLSVEKLTKLYKLLAKAVS